jgi:hypothetical protein
VNEVDVENHGDMGDKEKMVRQSGVGVPIILLDMHKKTTRLRYPMVLLTCCGLPLL